MEFSWMDWIIIPLLIALSRIVDVSLQTVRFITIQMGKRKTSSIIGFIEVTIWLVAITQIMQRLTNPACYIGYGLGFAIGNYIGIAIGNILPFGVQVVRIITKDKLETLQMTLRDEGYGVTTVEGHGGRGPVSIIYVIGKRTDIARIIEVAKLIEPDAFITISDVKSSHSGFIKKDKWLHEMFSRK